MEFVCSSCSSCFSRRDNLVRHIKRNKCSSLIIHEKNGQARFLCETCGVTFSAKKNCIRHIVNGTCFHSKKGIPSTTKDKSASKKKEDTHVRTLEFASNAEFLLWKDIEEQRTLSKYSQDYGSWKTKTGKKIRYRCHRTGFARLKGPESRKRHMRTKGSCKINNHCSAYILYEENQYDGGVTVQYNPSHCNHSLEMKHLPISTVDKENIAEKLRVGVPLDRVLDDIRDTLNDEHFTRTQLITKHDLHNIMIAKKIRYQEQKSLVDTDSVELIIEEYRTKFGKDTPFKYYKEQGEKKDRFDEDDFFLVIMNSVQISLMKRFGCNIICVDSAHAADNCDFYLDTILVVNDLNMAVPVAHAISNKQSIEFMRKFIKIIKEECGVIHTKVFMSDDISAYLNTWTMVMGKPKNILLYPWHVDKNLRKNLKLVNGPKELKDEAYKFIRDVMEEKDVASFPTIVISALEKLLNDPNTTEFGKYFERDYANRYEMWAFAFRKYIGIDANTKIEAMHRELKNVYFHGLKNKRLDKMITTLLRMNRNKAFERVSNLIMETDETLKKVKDRHANGTKIPAEDISVINDEIGIVKSQSNESTVYEIQKIANECYCRLRCKDCQGICVHLYKCTCDDYVFGYNLCKHIHAYASKAQFVDTGESIDNESKNFTKVENLFTIFQTESTAEVISVVPQTRECIEIIAMEIIKNNKYCEGMEMDEYDNMALSVLKQVNEMLQMKVEGIKNKK